MSFPAQGTIHFWSESPHQHPIGKKPGRRWVIVSRDAFNAHQKYVLACPITSYPPTVLDIAVPATPHNTLEHDSSMIVPMVTPILKDQLRPTRGRVAAKVLRPVLEKLRLVLQVV
jgi:mRNA-degrading endonuclease toxin of MazEF toxin-antitoxin module